MIDTRMNLFRLLLLLMAVLFGGCTTTATQATCVPEDSPYAISCYSSADVVGRIVDAKTGQPIEGAVVVGIWQLESQGFEHYYGAAIHVVESVSDAEGNYRLKGFEGIDIRRFGGGELMDSDPDISVFAEGYRPGGARRDPILQPGTGYRRVSPLNGRDIELKREALNNDLIASIWGGGIRSLTNAGGCAITDLPSLKALLERIEPQYDKLYKAEFGVHKTPYKNALNRCKEGKNP